jgi:hypothetical protein
LKRYIDLESEGIPKEALALISTLKSLDCAGAESYIQKLIDVYTRGKELIVVLDSPA